MPCRYCQQLIDKQIARDLAAVDVRPKKITILHKVQQTAYAIFKYK